MNDYPLRKIVSVERREHTRHGWGGKQIDASYYDITDDAGEIYKTDSEALQKKAFEACSTRESIKIAYGLQVNGVKRLTAILPADWQPPPMRDMRLDDDRLD